MIFRKTYLIQGMLLAASCSSIATATPITFGCFTGTFPYTENGFNVISTQTPSRGGWGSGYPGGIGTRSGGRIGTYPSGQPDYGSPTATIEVTCNDHGLFFFNSVDLFGGVAENCYYTLVGLLNGSTIFIEWGGLDVWQPIPQFVTINGNPSLQIDSLSISFDTDPHHSTYFSLKNIDLAAVPDNFSTLVMFGISASALILFGRQQRLMTTR